MVSEFIIYFRTCSPWFLSLLYILEPAASGFWVYYTNWKTRNTIKENSPFIFWLNSRFFYLRFFNRIFVFLEWSLTYLHNIWSINSYANQTINQPYNLINADKLTFQIKKILKPIRSYLFWIMIILNYSKEGISQLSIIQCSWFVKKRIECRITIFTKRG